MCCLNDQIAGAKIAARVLAADELVVGLDKLCYFDKTRNMEMTANTKQALSALAALSQEVGAIAERLSLANATLSFHLKELSNSGLIVAAPNGRAIIYSANFPAMDALIGYLTENCCAGATCATTVACKPTRAKRHYQRT